MKRLSYTRSVSQDETPILDRLESCRHQLADNEDADWHEMAPQSAFTDTGAAELSSASTLIVTDSDLAASWIYKTKKAAASQEKLDTCALGAPPPPPPPQAVNQRAEDNDSLRDRLSPFTLELPARRSKSSCCCFFVVLLVIFVCGVGILSSIGGVVYLEVFAAKRNVTRPSNGLLAKTDPVTIGPTEADGIPQLLFETITSTQSDNVEVMPTETPDDGQTERPPTTEFEAVVDVSSTPPSFHETSTSQDVPTSPLFPHETSTSQDGVPTVGDSKGLDVSPAVPKDDNVSKTRKPLPSSSSKRRGNVPTSPPRRRRPDELRASIAEAMKRFQSLDIVDLPSTRVQNPSRSSRRNTDGPVDDEQSAYLDRLRLLLYDNTR